MNVPVAQNVNDSLARELARRGVGIDKMPMLMAQAAGETGGFKSHVSQVRNYSGIKFYGQPEATDSGIKSPEGDNYAAYASDDLWAKDYLNIITRKADALNATSIEDFAARLKKAGYFTATLDSYIAMLKSWQPTFSKNISNWLTPVIIAADATLLFFLLINILTILAYAG